jgi:hypothetical protein
LNCQKKETAFALFLSFVRSFCSFIHSTLLFLSVYFFSTFHIISSYFLYTFLLLFYFSHSIFFYFSHSISFLLLSFYFFSTSFIVLLFYFCHSIFSTSLILFFSTSLILFLFYFFSTSFIVLLFYFCHSTFLSKQLCNSLFCRSSLLSQFCHPLLVYFDYVEPFFTPFQFLFFFLSVGFRKCPFFSCVIDTEGEKCRLERSRNNLQFLRYPPHPTFYP